jgi:hypothetical protein
MIEHEFTRRLEKMMKEKMDLFCIVMKLIGPVNPIGDTNTDSDRLENLKELLELTDNLLTVIDRLAMQNKDSKECSVRKAGQLCDEWQVKMGISE